MPLLLQILLTTCLTLGVSKAGWASDTVPAADSKQIRFNVSPKGYPPFMIVNDDGSASGIVWDTLNLVAERHGYSVKGLEIPRKRVDDFILEGRIDATARAIEWTEEPERFAFTKPLLQVQEVFFKRAGDPFEYRSRQDLVGKRVVTHLGYQYPRLEALFASGRTERFDAQHESDMLNYLRAGNHFDLVVAVLQVGFWHIRQHGWEDEFDYAPQPVSEHGYRLMFSKDLQPFVELFNNELEKIKASGEFDRILARYR